MDHKRKVKNVENEDQELMLQQDKFTLEHKELIILKEE
jgi:hypothetical protein